MTRRPFSEFGLCAFRVALLVVAFCAPAGAVDWELVLDPKATTVRFELGATLHTVLGTLAVRSGALRFDPATGSVAGSVVIDARSARTGRDSRDRNMHEQVLESARFPDIVLHAERLRIDERGPDTLRGALEGRIEIHGGSHAIRIPFEASRTDAQHGRVTGRFEVPYVDWGLRDVSTFVLRVERVLTIEFSAEGELEGL